jgi:AcrR family transcriptional regulator
MRDTKGRILDAAEKVINEQGADKATLRMITAEANVNLAAINYHFGSKGNLVDEIFTRYIRPMEEDRIRRLEKAEAEAGEAGPELETIIRCYLEPVLDFITKHPDHNHIFFQLHKPSGSWERFRWQAYRLIEPGLNSFFKVLSRALPDIPRENLLARMAFMLSSISLLLNNYWIVWEFQTLFGLSFTPQKLVDELVAYTAAGVRGEITDKLKDL